MFSIERGIDPAATAPEEDAANRRRPKHMPVKKWESEEQIHARIRELTGELRQLRHELRSGTSASATANRGAVPDLKRRTKITKKR
jgi:hypothetical protein